MTWLAPAVPAVVVTGYLAWGAWVSVRDPGWLTRSSAWWRILLRPGDNRSVLAVVSLWLATLACYWWPRRLRPRSVGLALVVGMVSIGGFLGLASLGPCHGRDSEASVVAAVLDLYVGQPAAYPAVSAGVCPGPQPPLALQLASAVCLGATLVGALTAAAVLWRYPVGRLRARLVRDATVFAGLDALTLPLLRRLAETGRPGGIVVIEPDAEHPLLEDARATGAKVMIASPASSSALLPVLASRRGCALRYLYALRPDVAENEAIMEAAGRIVRRLRPAEHEPHLVVRIDDPRHANHWRWRHAGQGGGRWFSDALSAQETTAAAALSRVTAAGARQLLLCGDSTLGLTVLLELAWRAWERRGLDDAARRGGAPHPESPASLCGTAPANGSGPAGGRWPGGRAAVWPGGATAVVDRVLLLDQRALDLHREYLATCPRSMADSFPDITVRPLPWQDHLLALLDAMPHDEVAQTAILVVDQLTDASVHEAGRAARLHPGVLVLVPSADGPGTSEAHFDRLEPFQRTLLVGGDPPPDVWTRIARHWHECYRLAHPVPAGQPLPPGRRPWPDLTEFLRQDNIGQLRSVMTAVAACGRSWTPTREVPHGSFIELSRRELAEVAKSEHTRWYQRRRAAGWRPEAPPGRGSGPAGGLRAAWPGNLAGRARDNALVNSSVVPWAELPASQQARLADDVTTQLAQLEDIGFKPVVPRGGPPEAAAFCRVGTVRAAQLTTRMSWSIRSGSVLTAGAGDWRVLDEHGDERAVRDGEFQASHEQLSDGTWRRTGVFRAWRVSDEVVVRTLEGRAVARPGDWIVEGAGGNRWPVPDDQFRRGYRPA